MFKNYICNHEVAIKDLDVAGLAQKGPFVKGSAVTVQGVDCKTMKFTEEKFSGKVKSNKGDFDVDDVNLSASCALFEVSGYYLNEEVYDWDDYNEKLYASDRFGFNILQAGISFKEEYADLGVSTEFWTSSIETFDWITYATISPITLYFAKRGLGSTVYHVNIARAVSVRCVKGQGGKRNGYDFDAPRYEEDLPEEVDFIQDYVSDKDRRAWDDDSLMTFWYVRHITGKESVHTSGKNYSQYVSVSLEDDARDSLDLFKGVLEENGFAYVKSDSVGQTTYNGRDGIYFMHEVATSDSKVRRDYYEKETAKARYVIVVLVGDGGKPELRSGE